MAVLPRQPLVDGERRPVVVPPVGEVDAGPLAVAGGHDEAGHRHQPGDDVVDGREQGVEVAGVVGGFGDRVGGGLQVLGVVLFGDVPGDADAQLVGRGPAGRPHHTHRAAILAPVAVHEADPRLAGHDQRGLFEGPGAVFGQHEVEQRLADQLVRRVAEDGFAGRIDVADAPVGADEEHRVEEQIDAVEEQAR